MSSLTELGIIPHNEQYKSADTEPVAWMVYTKDGQSAFVTDNPTDIGDGQRALPLLLPRRPLTDDQIKAAVMGDPFFGAALMSMMRDNAMVSDVRQAIVGIFRAAERAHGITGGNK